MAEQVVIPRRFNGPPDSGHGGYSCALAARFVDGPAEVTLRSPPPLETPMDVLPSDGGVVLRAHGDVIAEAYPAPIDLEPPPPLDVAAAELAARDSQFLREESHPFPTCFACGPLRDAGDGLRIFAGPAEGGSFAAPWTPDPSLADERGRVTDDFVWAALDCPSSAPAMNPHGDPPVVLARLAVRIDDPPEAGRQHVLQSWLIGQEGRKHHTGVALYDDAGKLRALGRALWIELRP